MILYLYCALKILFLQGKKKPGSLSTPGPDNNRVQDPIAYESILAVTLNQHPFAPAPFGHWVALSHVTGI
jgi:hypothetical protein